VCERRCYGTVDPVAAAPSVGEARARAAAAPPRPTRPDDFVTVSPPSPGGGPATFALHGAPWLFSGTNFYSALYPWWTPDQVRAALVAHADRGASAARVFAFTNGANNTGYDMTLQTRPIQPAVGLFDEAALRRLDRLVADAGAAGLKLILALANVWDEGGGAQWYVDQVLGPAGEGDGGGEEAAEEEEEEGQAEPGGGGPPASSLSSSPFPARPKAGRRPRELFFFDPAVIAAYKAYVRVIVTRNNTVTGVPYAADPAILAW
jgi:hypothetical protein